MTNTELADLLETAAKELRHHDLQIKGMTDGGREKTSLLPICVNQKDAAALLGISVDHFVTLGIRGVKLGRCIRYRVRDLEAHIAKKQEEQR